MRRGEIRLTDLEAARGSEADKHRPAIIVSNDHANTAAPRRGRGVPPVQGAWGRPSTPHRPAVEGAIYRYRTGCAWRDLPAEFGPWQTVWKRHAKLSKDGASDRVLTVLLSQADDVGAGQP